MFGKITVTGVNKLFFVFTVLLILFQVVLGIMTGKYGSEYIESNTYYILLVNQYVLILLPVIAFVFVNRLNIREVFRLNRLSLSQGVMVVIMTALAYIPATLFNSILLFILQFIGNVTGTAIPVPQNSNELIKGIAIVAVSPAICEELLHRGILLKAYEKRGSIKAVIITAVFFGLFHFDLTNLPGATFMGLLLGYFVIRTNSIYAGMIGHFTNNLIYELLQYFGRDTQPAQNYISVTTEDLGFLMMYGVICLAAIWVFIKLFRKATLMTYRPKPTISTVHEDIISIISHWPIIFFVALYVLLMAVFFSTLS